MSVRWLLPLFSFLAVTSGCTNLISGVTSQLADDLAGSILNSEDIDTVKEGIPAYLLLIDSFLIRSPHSEDLLMAASNLNGSFSALLDNEHRTKLLTSKALAYSERAACAAQSTLCQIRSDRFQVVESKIAVLAETDVPIAYSLAVAWVGWIQAHSDDWAAVGELGKVKALMGRVIELDERYESGGPHLYMGGLETILPASLGGNPEKGKAHFERALAIDSRYLMTKVIYAEQYARLVFDQALHDRLLQEVIAADPKIDGMTLTNKVAQARARDLLLTSTEYF